MKYYKNTLIELQVRVGENRKIILAKRKLATTNHDSASRPQRSRFAKPTIGTFLKYQLTQLTLSTVF